MLEILEKIIGLVVSFISIYHKNIESTFVCNSTTNYIPMIAVSNLSDAPISLSKLFIEYKGVRRKEIDFAFDIKYSQFSFLKPHSQTEILMDDFLFGVVNMDDDEDKELIIIIIDTKKKKYKSKVFLSDAKICFNSFCNAIDKIKEP